MTKKYNPEIDVWKFVFSIVIFLFHSYKLKFTGGDALLGKGYLAVEFFYLVSGYFMAASVKRLEDKSGAKPAALGSETVKFIERKISRIYLPYINAFVIAFFVIQYTLSSGARQIVKSLTLSFNEIFML
nr:acyltransferase family protein [Clostridia bacterium]